MKKPNQLRSDEDRVLARKENQKRRAAKYRASAKFKITHDKWRKEGGREYQRQWTAAKRASQPKTIRPLHDSYVRQVLASRSGIHPSEIPADLVELQRIHLQLKREIHPKK